MKFIVTKELGKLARWLRILGFDTVYYTLEIKGRLVLQALREDRTIITRRKQKITGLETKTLVIETNDIKGQIKEVIKKLNLKIDKSIMFNRCVICNNILKEVKKDAIEEKAPPFVYETQEEFMHCSQCDKLYWKGSHWGNIYKTLEDLL